MAARVAMAPKPMRPKHVPGQRDLFGHCVAPDSPLPVALLTPAEAVVARAQAAEWARGKGSGKGNRGGGATSATVAPVPLGGGKGNWGPCILSGLVWQLRLDVSRLRLPYQPKTTCTHVPNPGSATETADAADAADAAVVDDGAMVEAELSRMLEAEPMEVDEEVVDVDEAREEWEEWQQDWRSDDAAKKKDRL